MLLQGLKNQIEVEYIPLENNEKDSKLVERIMNQRVQNHFEYLNSITTNHALMLLFQKKNK